MPIVHVTSWPTDSEVKAKLIKNLTLTVHETTGAPLDKITVYFQEVDPAQWGEGGSLGSEPDFKEKSRRLTYDD